MDRYPIYKRERPYSPPRSPYRENKRPRVDYGGRPGGIPMGRPGGSGGPGPGGSGRGGSYTVWLGNLAYDASEDVLFEKFSSVGLVKSVRIKYDRETGRGKGFGFVEFADEASAIRAQSLTGTPINGRPVRVELTGPDGGPPTGKRLGRHDPVTGPGNFGSVGNYDKRGYERSHDRGPDYRQSGYSAENEYRPEAPSFSSSTPTASSGNTTGNPSSGSVNPLLLQLLLAQANQKQQQEKEQRERNQQHQQKSDLAAAASLASNTTLLQTLLQNAQGGAPSTVSNASGGSGTRIGYDGGYDSYDSHGSRGPPADYRDSYAPPPAYRPHGPYDNGSDPYDDYGPPRREYPPARGDYDYDRPPRRDYDRDDRPPPRRFGDEGRGSHTIFVGSLHDDTREEEVLRFFSRVGEIVAIKWVNDKNTGKFKGCCFIEYLRLGDAAEALNLTGGLIGGRPVRVGHAADEPGGLLAHGGTIVGRGPPPPPPLRSPPRGRGFDRGPDRRGRYPGDGYRDHPPSRYDRGPPPRGYPPEPRPRPSKVQTPHQPGGKTIFVGSLANSVTDEAMRELFKDVGAPIVAIRWLENRRTGQFKGCGFIEFATEQACINAGKLNGEIVMGRPIRIDFEDTSRGPRQESAQRGEEKDGESSKGREKREEEHQSALPQAASKSDVLHSDQAESEPAPPSFVPAVPEPVVTAAEAQTATDAPTQAATTPTSTIPPQNDEGTQNNAQADEVTPKASDPVDEKADVEMVDINQDQTGQENEQEETSTHGEVPPMQSNNLDTSQTSPAVHSVDEVKSTQDKEDEGVTATKQANGQAGGLETVQDSESAEGIQSDAVASTGSETTAHAEVASESMEIDTTPS